MEIKRRLVLSTALGLAALPLPRAGLAEPAQSFPPPQLPLPQSIWTGPYAGIQLGWAGSASPSVGCTFVGASPCSPDGTPAMHVNNALTGFDAGYSWQWGWWLLGAEADLDALGVYDTEHFPGRDNGYYSNGAKLTSGYDWLGTARARTGIVVDRTLFFATGGFAAAGVQHSYSDLLDNTASTSGTRTGWTAGAGVEYALTEKFSLKAEYLYVGLPSSSLTVNNYNFSSMSPFGGTSTLKFHNDLNIVRAGLNFHF